MASIALREVSAKVFGNEKTAEVVRALAAQNHTATAQQIAQRTGIGHSLVGDVLKRLAAASLAKPLPRSHTRGALYYEADPDDEVWVAMVRLTDTMFDRHERTGDLGDSDDWLASQVRPKV